MRIDLNADVGEGLPTDPQLIPLVSSVNIACGGHAGDEGSMREAITRALAAGAAVGAHPSYPDRQGFGRRSIAISHDELVRSLADQLEAIVEVATELRATVGHVKPHGALYNDAAVDERLAALVADTVASTLPSAGLVGLAGSRSLVAARVAGLRPVAEAFADRAYESDGSLRSRSLPGAVHDDAETVRAQALAIVRDRRVHASDGRWISVEADTLCIHGDTPGAVALAAAVRESLAAAGVSIGPPP